jgi:hypothetical protein
MRESAQFTHLRIFFTRTLPTDPQKMLFVSIRFSRANEYHYLPESEGALYPKSGALYVIDPGAFYASDQATNTHLPENSPMKSSS